MIGAKSSIVSLKFHPSDRVVGYGSTDFNFYLATCYSKKKYIYIIIDKKNINNYKNIISFKIFFLNYFFKLIIKKRKNNINLFIS